MTRLDSIIEKMLAEKADLERRIQAFETTLSTIRLDYDEDQPRDEAGRWTDGGGGGGGYASAKPTSVEETDRSLSGRRGMSRPSESKQPSEGLKGISERVGKSFQDLKGGEEKPKDPKKSREYVAKMMAMKPEEMLKEHGPQEWHGKAKGSLDTKTAYEKDGKYSPERKAVHDKYIKDHIEARKEEELPDGKTKFTPLGHDVPKEEEPTLYMTGGGPASGKTTGLLKNPDAGIPGTENAAHINADEAKEYIPEYKAGKKAGDFTAASFTHEESSDIAKKGVGVALRAGHHVVFDSTGDSGVDNLEKKIAQYRAQGAKKVIANYATLDVNKAIERSDERAKNSGRFVPHAYIRANHRDVSNTVQGAIQRGLFDKLDVWDTSGPKGSKPVHIATYTKEAGLKVHDQGAWEAFKKRGDGTP